MEAEGAAHTSGATLNTVSLLVESLKAYLGSLEAGGGGGAPPLLPDFALTAFATLKVPTPGGAKPKPVELKVMLNQLDARLDALEVEGPARAERKSLLVALAALHARLVRLPAPDPPDAAPPAAPPSPARAQRSPPPPSPPTSGPGAATIAAVLVGVAAAAAAAAWGWGLGR
jgi:hypothetical protein